MTFGNGTARSYGWDAAGRLAGISVDLADSAADQRIGQAGGGGTALGYNAAAQLVSAVRANTAYAWGGSYNVNRTYANNGLNQVTAAASTVFGYDARGNLTSSGGTTYGYDGLNQLTSVSGGWNATLSWDTAGRLNQVSAPGSSATRFLYDGSALIGEYSTSGALLRRYVHGPGTDEPMVWYEGAATTDRRFLQADERGSVIAVSDSAGGSLAINRYDEYGIPQVGNAGRFQYTGQVWLPEAGLYWYKARMYSPSLGRFMQTDPIGYGDGLNWYGYVGGDPVNRTDPTGLKCPISDHCTTVYFNSGEAGYWERRGYSTLVGDDGDITPRGKMIFHSFGSSLTLSLLERWSRPFNIVWNVDTTGEIDGMPQSGTHAAKPVDYCGAAGSEGVPEGMAATSFQGACRKHDDCYGTLGKTQEQCDQGLGRDILDECKRTGGWLCALSAYVYYRALAGIPGLISPGKTAYDNAQRETRLRLLSGGRP